LLRENIKLTESWVGYRILKKGIRGSGSPKVVFYVGVRGLPSFPPRKWDFRSEAKSACVLGGSNEPSSPGVTWQSQQRKTLPLTDNLLLCSEEGLALETSAFLI